MQKIGFLVACLHQAGCRHEHSARIFSNSELCCQSGVQISNACPTTRMEIFRLLLLSSIPISGLRSQSAQRIGPPTKNYRYMLDAKTQQQRSVPIMNDITVNDERSVKRVTSLNNETFTPSLNAVEGLAVVKFFAPWCRTCKALAPQFEAIAEKYEGMANFFEVDFSRERQVCRDNRILVLPTIMFYVPEVGTIDRFSWKRTTAQKFQTRLETLLTSGNLQQLRALNPDVLTPLVRFKELYGSVQAIRKAPEYLQEKERWLTDQQTNELKELFRILDRNGDGVIDETEFEDVCFALVTGVPKEKLKACDFAPEDVLGIITAADGDDSTHALDEATFVRLMAHRAKEDILDPNALLDIFEALDTNGNGLINVQDLVKALVGVRSALGDDGAALGEIRDAEQDALLRAFDLHDIKNGSASINYEEFVSMLTGRGIR